jgi:nucleotide-binding universal stress UspA family protein
MIARILLPLDGSPLAERALPYGLRLASVLGAKLLLMHGQLPEPTATEPAFDLDGFAAQLRDGRILPTASVEGVEIETIIREIRAGRVAESICEAISSRVADLVVMSTHGHSGLGRWLYGSVAEQVLSQSPVPVVLISATADHTWTMDAPFRILVPLDGSRFGEEVLGKLDDVALPMKAELVLVGAAGPLESAYSAAAPTVRAGFDTALQETQAYLESVAGPLRERGYTVAVDAEIGRPGPIVEGVMRRRHIDLIAMATHGRTGIARLALGSVATEMLQRSTVPLLLWRPAALREMPVRTLTTSAP